MHLSTKCQMKTFSQLNVFIWSPKRPRVGKGGICNPRTRKPKAREVEPEEAESRKAEQLPAFGWRETSRESVKSGRVPPSLDLDEASFRSQRLSNYRARRVKGLEERRIRAELEIIGRSVRNSPGSWNSITA